MGKGGVPEPDAVCYSAAIAACARPTVSAPSAWKDALRILSQMANRTRGGPGATIRAVSGAMAAATNAREITSVAHELHGRIRKFVEHFERAGSQMGAAVKAYNAAVGSLERNLLTSARRLRALSAAPEEDVGAPDSLADEVRPITSAELLPRPDREK